MIVKTKKTCMECMEEKKFKPNPRQICDDCYNRWMEIVTHDTIYVCKQCQVIRDKPFTCGERQYGKNFVGKWEQHDIIQIERKYNE